MSELFWQHVTSGCLICYSGLFEAELCRSGSRPTAGWHQHISARATFVTEKITWEHFPTMFLFLTLLCLLYSHGSLQLVCWCCTNVLTKHGQHVENFCSSDLTVAPLRPFTFSPLPSGVHPGHCDKYIHLPFPLTPATNSLTILDSWKPFIFLQCAKYPSALGQAPQGEQGGITSLCADSTEIWVPGWRKDFRHERPALALLTSPGKPVFSLLQGLVSSSYSFQA